VGFQLFIAGAPIRQLGFGLLAGVLATGAYIALRPYALARWTGFLDPWATANREGFQLVQSFVAFGRGGNFGVPLGDGRQKLFYLPEAHTDFILSGIAEEAGLLGVLVVLAAFASFIAAGTRIAMRTRDSFATQMAFGMTALVGLPAAINAGVVMGLLPTTGFTLPFISYGANSMVMCAITVGLLLRISACEAAPQVVRISGAARRGSIS
ncbi:MAG: FtsW/RodA/SpoVE family cell cycle protein, partial [Myxococcota bacterium]